MQKSSLRSLLEFLSPTKTEAMLYVIAGLTLIVAAKSANFFNNLTANFGAGDSIKRIWMDSVNRLGEYSDVSGALLWFLAGSALYLMIWMAAVILIDWYNDVLVSTSFVHPKSFHQSEYWVAILGRFLIRVSSAVLFIALIVITIGSFIPAGYSYAISGWTGGSILTAAFNFIVIITIALGSLHSATLLLRLTFMRRRLYS